MRSDVPTAAWRSWQLRLQNFGIAVAIWFGSGFVSGLVFPSVGFATRTYARLDLFGSLIFGVTGLLVLGPVCHVFRKRAWTAGVVSALAEGVIVYAFRIAAHVSLSDRNLFTLAYDAIIPFLVGAGTAWFCLKCYRWQGWI